MDPFSPAVLWIVVVGFIIAFILAFGIGANDVANSFGTSVGSGVLTIRQACWLATVCEVTGAVLIGYKVSDTMRKGILTVDMYVGNEAELMLGCLSALASSAIWLLVATFLKLPISGTHSIVGSTIGFSLVAKGTEGLKWSTLGTIVGSWFISPLMSGLVSTVLYLIIRKFILNVRNPFKAGLIALPMFYGVTIFINVFSVVHDGPKLLKMDNIPTWIALVISLCIAITVAILVQLIVVPWQKRKILGPVINGKPVKFTFGDSTESSPNGSPRHAKRPVSLVCDGKPLPAITETTELVSLSTEDKNNEIKKMDFTDLSNPFPISNGNYKIDPDIVKKAENLLGKVSLDNTDLTVTSLNYIDEHQNGILGNGKSLQLCFDHRLNNNSPKSPPFIDGTLNNNNLTMNNVIKSPNHNHEHIEPPSSQQQQNQLQLPKNVLINGGPEYKDLNNVESAGSLDQMISTTLSPNSSKVPLIEPKDEAIPKGVQPVSEENEEVSKLFSFLQILTATFGSFAHGGNDVSNAIGPLIALFMIYCDGSVLQKSETPIYILIFGGVGISVGLWLWGRRVIETIGNDLTKITPSTGFTIEVGAALTVLLASKIGLPISTTHCKVGSVVFVGHTSSKVQQHDDAEHGILRPPKQAVDWGLFRNIVYAWVITVPVAAALSALMMWVLTKLVL